MQPNHNPSHYGSKLCTHCGQIEALTSFHPRTAAKDGRQTYCVQCDAEIGRINTWRREYGLLPGRVRRCLEIQGDKCPLCGDPLAFEIIRGESRIYDRSDELVIDYHPEGLIRGVVHRRCNHRKPTTAEAARRWQEYTTNPPMTTAYDGIPKLKPDTQQNTLFDDPQPRDIGASRKGPHPQSRTIQ